jgi:hypothetical protein
MYQFLISFLCRTVKRYPRHKSEGNLVKMQRDAGVSCWRHKHFPRCVGELIHYRIRPFWSFEIPSTEVRERERT